MSNLYAIHDFDPAWARIVSGAGHTGWAVTTHALGSDPHDQSGYDYAAMGDAGMMPLARLNNGYEPGGTIPLPNLYPDFAQRCANWADNSRGCIRWIIGNEPNLSVERPGGIPITAQQYAQCFVLCRNLIKQRGLQHQVIVGAVGPWNVQTGDWIQYWKDVLLYIGANGGCDGLSIHTYARTNNPADIASDAKMQAAGYTDRYANFRAYRDLMNAIPSGMRHLPVYLTESDVLPGWADANTGVVKAMYQEIDSWNHTAGMQPIQCLALYRWTRNEGQNHWAIVDKRGVQNDFADAVAIGYSAPLSGLGQQEGTVVESPIVSDGPTAPPPQPGAVTFEATIDPRLLARGVTLSATRPNSGGYWRVRDMRWLDVQEAINTGPVHHILGEIMKDGSRAVLVPFLVSWPSGQTKPTDVVSKASPGVSYNYDYPMSKSLREFTIRVNDGNPSDVVSGIGMGKDNNPAIHTSTWIDWEWAEVLTQPGPPESTPPAPVQPLPCVPADQKMAVPALVHPLADAAQRIATENFGDDPDYYKQYAVDGVALQGHNGLDFGVPVGTPVRAVADGTVREAWNEPNGYGNLVLLDHTWGQSLYAHLDGRYVEPGDSVLAGETIARSGASGKVTGPHLHFGMRVFPFARQDGWGGYSDPAPYLQHLAGQPSGVTAPAHPIGIVPPIQAAAIAQVESRGQAFNSDGSMVIRFEPHIFQAKVDAAFFDAHFKVGDPIWNGDQHQFYDLADNSWKPFHGNQVLEYRALTAALALDEEAAYASTSMGAGQVMGFNATAIGFANARQMFAVLRKSSVAQIVAVINYCLENPDLVEAMKQHDYHTVASLYNGPANADTYAQLMNDEEARLLA